MLSASAPPSCAPRPDRPKIGSPTTVVWTAPAPKHRTTLQAAPPEIPTLMQLCLAKLTAHSTNIVDLSGLEETTGLLLLQRILAEQKLTYNLAMTFIRSFPGTALAEALERLDLHAGIPSYPKR